jgi:hypothetical protein
MDQLIIVTRIVPFDPAFMPDAVPFEPHRSKTDT